MFTIVLKIAYSISRIFDLNIDISSIEFTESDFAVIHGETATTINNNDQIDEKVSYEAYSRLHHSSQKIGRASCRERV